MPSPLFDIMVASKRITASGLNDFTHDGFFGSPSDVKCGLTFGGIGITAGTPASDCGLSIGAFDGANQVVSTTLCEDSSMSGSYAYNRQATDESIMVLRSGGAVASEASFDSFIANGVRLNFTASGVGAGVMLFGGDAVENAYVGTASGPSSGATDVTAPGFEPNVVICFGTRASSFGDTANTGGGLFLGLCTNLGGTVTQNVLAWGVTDNSYPTESWGRITTGRISQNQFEGTLFASHSLTTFDAAGFSVQQHGSAGTTIFGYLAMKLRGVEVYTGTAAFPGSAAGEHSVGEARARRRPVGGLILGSNLAADNSDQQNNTAAPIGIGAWSYRKGQSSFAMRNEDNTSRSDASSLWHDDRSVHLPSGTASAAQHDAGIQSPPANNDPVHFFRASSGGAAKRYLWLNFHDVEGLETPQVVVSVPELVPPAGHLSFVDHFDRSALNDARWSSATAGAGTVSLAASTVTVESASAADAAFLSSARKLDLTQSQLWQLCVQFRGGSSTTGDLISVVQSASTPSTVANQTAVDAARRWSIGLDVGGTPDVITMRHNPSGDSSGDRYWDGEDQTSPNTWTAAGTAGVAVSNVGVGDSAEFYVVGFEFDAALDRFRLFAMNKGGATAITTLDQGARITALTDWVPLTDFTADVDSLWLVVGDRNTGGGTCELSIEYCIMETETA